jgi:Cleft lip and palate transmembrane protein 1 (CLPTM1)
VELPIKTRRNGTLFMYVILALDDKELLDWKDFQRDGPTVIQRISLTQFVVPKEAAFNLLNESGDKKPKKSDLVKPRTHIKTKVFLSILTEKASMSPQDVTPELARMVRVSKKYEFLPMVQSNVLKERFQDLIEVTKNFTKVEIEFNYAPSSVGKFRLIAHIESAMSQLNALGFSSKDVDEVKSIFADANLYLLCGTLLIGSLHVSILFYHQHKHHQYILNIYIFRHYLTF